jgi:hypothetical protein
MSVTLYITNDTFHSYPPLDKKSRLETITAVKGSNHPTRSISFINLLEYGIKLSSFWITEGQIQQQNELFVFFS